MNLAAGMIVKADVIENQSPPPDQSEGCGICIIVFKNAVDVFILLWTADIFALSTNSVTTPFPLEYCVGAGLLKGTMTVAEH